MLRSIRFAVIVLGPRPGATKVRLQARVVSPMSGWLSSVPPGRSMMLSPLRVGAPMAMCSPQTHGMVSGPRSRGTRPPRASASRTSGSASSRSRRKPDGADRAADAHLVRGVVDDPAVPRRHAGLGVQAKVGAPVGGRKAAGGEYRLPPALVEVHPQAQRRPGRGDELRWVAHPPGRAPEKVDVGRLWTSSRMSAPLSASTTTRSSSFSITTVFSPR